jgi:glycopeptide antibiotics resistance protein
MAQTALRILAWGSMVALFIVTDTTMQLRPHTIISPNADRFLALFVAGAIFALAYPRRILIVVAVLLAAVIGFELLQRLIAGRHGYIKDILVKASGVCAGTMFITIVRQILGRSTKPPPLP